MSASNTSDAPTSADGHDWPKGWTAARRRRWSRLSGTRELATAWYGAGWHAQEVIDAHRHLDLAQPVPAGAAAGHRRHGPALEQLLAGDWPPAPPGCVVSVRTTGQDGSRRRTSVSRDNAGLHWHQATPGGSSAVLPLDLSTDAATALADELVLRPELMIEVTADDGLLVQVLEAASVGPGVLDPELWPDELAEPWLAEDEDLGSILPVDQVRRWAKLNELRLVVVTAGLHLAGGVLAIDLLEEEPALGQELVRFDWHSEGGGAPISWDGHGAVTRHGAVLLFRLWGDNGTTVHLSPALDDEAALGTSLAYWLEAEGMCYPLALTFEPWADNPPSDEGRRALWDERADVGLSLELNLRPACRQALHAEMLTSAPYQAFAHVAAHPDSPLADRFYEDLECVLADGVPGPLMHQAFS